MSVTFAPPPGAQQQTVEPNDTGVRARRWTRQDFHRAASLGLFRPEERLELIEGELIEKMGENPPHASAIRRCRILLERIFEPLGAFLSIQSPVTLSDAAEPEPDLAVVQGALEAFDARHPAPADLLLVVEVSDTTLVYDRQNKAALYASAGIQEYWIVSLPERRLEVHRIPQNGSYQVIQSLGETQSIAPLAASEKPILVADLLPSSSAL